MPRLGAHMSIAGGLYKALSRGQSAGCETIQIFTRNASQWRAKDLSEEAISRFLAARSECDIHPIVAHSSYLINLASPDNALWQKSCKALIVELQRCAQLEIRAYVLHPGAHTGSGEDAGLQRVTDGLTKALRATDSTDVKILLETTAGQGTSLGRSFEQLAWLIDHAVPEARLGVCFDTAHAFAAGYDFRDAEAYAAMLEQFDSVIGIDRLGLLHLNDSKRELGSHVDRHTHIGEGFIGVEAFRRLVTDPVLNHLPMVLETPKGPDLADDRRNLGLLRSLRDGEGQAADTNQTTTSSPL